MIIITTLCCAITVLVAAFWYLYDFNYWKKKNVAGPAPIPFFGNIKELSLRKIASNDFYRDLYSKYPNEKVVGIYRYKTPCLVLRDLEAVKSVMIKDFDKFVDRAFSFGEKSLGKNLFAAEPDTWRVLRSRFSPMFTSGKLKNMLYLMNRECDKFLDFMERTNIAGSKKDVFLLTQKYTSMNIASCAFGIDIDVDELDRPGNTLTKINNIIFNSNIFFDFEQMFPGALKQLGLPFFAKVVVDYFYNLTKSVKAARNGKPSGRKDFMDLMLEMQQQGTIHGNKKHEDDKERKLEVNDAIITAQTFVFYAGGLDTTATTMSFMMYELARNPDIQERLVDEINRVVKECDGEIDLDVLLKKMPFLSQVFDETLRLYPIVDPLQRRLVDTSYQVPETDVTIEKGTLVLVPVTGIHYDPKYHKDPLKFDPDRFSPENVKNMDPYSYLPFGIGPRNCVGMRFAFVQTRVLLTRFLPKYRIKLPAGADPHAKVDFDTNRIVLAPKKWFELEFEPRN